MGQNVGEIDLDLVLQSKAFKKQLSNEVNSAMKSVDKTAGGLTGTFGKLGKVIAGAFAVKQIVAFGKECLKLGSDLTEVQNVVDVTFGSMSGEIDRFAKSAIETFGLSETVAKRYAGTFGAMAKSFGFAGKDAVVMSETLTGLAGDVASFYNISPDESYTKLKSVFTGETESLKELGVVMTQTALDQYAMQNGYGKTTAKMTEQEKVALRYNFVLSKLSDAQGDFARTSDSWANQTRVLSLRFDALKASIGQGLINVLTPVVKWLNIILSKLQAVADAFASFTAKIMGISSKATGGTGAIAGDLAAAAEGANATADGVGAAGSAAKKAAKSMMAIDELNTLSDTSASDAGGGAGSGIDMGELDGVEEAAEKVEDKFAEMREFLQQLKTEFSEGWKLGFKDADLDGLKTSLKNIQTLLKDIFTAPEVVGAAKNWATAVSKSIGMVAGSVARTAINIANTLVGGIEKYLQQHGGEVKQFIVDMFDIKAETATIFGNLSVAIADIFGNVFGTDVSKQLVADVINIFATVSGTIIELSAKLCRDVLGAIAAPIIANKDAIGEALGGIVEFVGSIIGTISTGISETAATIQTVYDTYIAPMFTALGNGLSTIAEGFLTFWNGTIKPILDEWGDRFSKLWEEHIQPAIDNILVALGKLCQFIGVVWEQYLAPFIAWFAENVLPVIGPVIKVIGDALMILFGIIGDVISGVMTVLQGILDFLIGVFTGDWDKAWQGVKEIFSGIWNAIVGVLSGVWDLIESIVMGAIDTVVGFVTTGFNNMVTIVTSIMSAIKNTICSLWKYISSNVKSIVGDIANGISSAFSSMVSTVSRILNGLKNIFKSVFDALVAIVKAPINAIIGMINKMIDGLNGLHIDIPEGVPFVGGKSVGFDIGHLPTLANGGFVEANSPQLAMIGDNKREGEIVAPESKIAEAVAAGMSTVMNQLAGIIGGGAQSGSADDNVINLYIGSELLDSFIVNSNNRRALRSGGRA